MKRLFVFLLCAVLLLLTVCPAFAAVENGVSGAERLKDPAGDLIGIQNRGSWHSYPENSLAALSAAADTGIDMVLADVSFSKNGSPVLLEETAVFRMLGRTEYTLVGECPDEWLREQRLKQRAGGEQEEYSDHGVCFLEDALKVFCDKKSKYCQTGLILKTTAANSYALTVVLEDFVKNNPSAQKYLPALFITGKKAEIKAAVQSIDKRFAVITQLRSNIVFEVTGFIKECAENGAAAVNLMTTNRYGVIFNQTVLKHRDKLRMLSNTADSETAGARADTAAWWDDLLSRGYSVIITNDAEGFVKYKTDIKYAKNRLSTLYKQAGENESLPEFKSTALNDYYKAYADADAAVTALLSREACSLKELNDAYAAYQKALDDIQANYRELTEGTAGLTVTLPRILLCVLAALLVVPVQIFFYKKRKKT